LIKHPAVNATRKSRSIVPNSDVASRAEPPLSTRRYVSRPRSGLLISCIQAQAVDSPYSKHMRRTSPIVEHRRFVSVAIWHPDRGAIITSSSINACGTIAYAF